MQQLRDAQITVESLHSQVSKLQGCLQLSEMARGRSEFCLEMMEILMGRHPIPRVIMPAVPPRAWNMVRTKRKYKETHPDGSSVVMWLTDTDISGSDKENYDIHRTLSSL
jgi:hypothetical protein